MTQEELEVAVELCLPDCYSLVLVQYEESAEYRGCYHVAVHLEDCLSLDYMGGGESPPITLSLYPKKSCAASTIGRMVNQRLLALDAPAAKLGTIETPFSLSLPCFQHLL